MALITCPECKKQISDTAESCPSCGYKLSPEHISAIKKEEEDPSLARLRLKQKNEKEQEEKNLSIVVQIIAVIFIVGIIYSCSGSKGEVEAVEAELQAEVAPTEEELSASLTRSCLQNIKENLNDPSSFEEIETRAGKSKSGDDTYRVAVSYRATNGFGALTVHFSQCDFIGTTLVSSKELQ